MKKSIFNIFVPITSQEQADRLKQVCLDNGLPYCKSICFEYEKGFKEYFSYSDNYNEFFLTTKNGLTRNNSERIETTEQEFMELLKEYKNSASENSRKNSD